MMLCPSQCYTLSVIMRHLNDALSESMLHTECNNEAFQ